jgi:hypothetical protein
MSNRGDLNLRAYAVENGTNLFVTIINKEHGAGSCGARVRILAPGFASQDDPRIDLTARSGSVEATGGISLGNGIITNNAP